MAERAPHREGIGQIPSKGDRVELVRFQTGVRIRVVGTVFYADQVQILVKWDDGRSESLRTTVDGLRIIE